MAALVSSVSCYLGRSHGHAAGASAKAIVSGLVRQHPGGAAAGRCRPSYARPPIYFCKNNHLLTSCAATSPLSSEEDPPFLKDVLVPSSWTSADTAAQESEWLRVTLHQWLDDEYCPELANDEISRRCAKVYYYCLMEKQLDIGDILMQMVRDLETFSFKESFHGAFSSANAAVDLIIKKICSLEGGM